MSAEQTSQGSANGPGVRFLGLDFQPLTLDDAVARIVDEARRETDFKYVVTPNVDHMVRLDREPGLKSVYDPAWLTVCDSRILELIARFGGLSLPSCPGADIVEALFDRHIAKDDPIVIIGGNEHIISALKARYGVRSIAWHNPPMGLRHNPQAIQAAADFVAAQDGKWVFLCVGSPQQEMLAKAIVETGNATGIGICCGASLEFLTGSVQRAPRWMREHGMEWLHRLISEPRRLWKRYLVDGVRILGIWQKHARS